MSSFLTPFKVFLCLYLDNNDTHLIIYRIMFQSKLESFALNDDDCAITQRWYLADTQLDE